MLTALAVTGQTLSAGLVIKGNLASIGPGLQTETYLGFVPIPVTTRLLDVAVGSRLAPPLGMAVGTVLADDVRSPHGLLNGFHGPSLDFCLFAGPRPANWHSGRLTFVHLGAKPWGRPTLVRAGVGVDLTFWMLNPEVEAGYRFVRGYYPEHQEPELHELHQYSIFLRLGLGGWFKLRTARTAARLGHR